MSILFSRQEWLFFSSFDRESVVNCLMFIMSFSVWDGEKKNNWLEPSHDHYRISLKIYGPLQYQLSLIRFESTVYDWKINEFRTVHIPTGESINPVVEYTKSMAISELFSLKGTKLIYALFALLSSQVHE